MSRDTLIETHDRGVLEITLNRPRRKNAFNNRMWCDLRDALIEARSDDDVRVVLVTGSGDAFTAGQDLSEMGTPPPGETPGFPSFMDQLAAFDKPLVAAVNGVGVGIGLTFLLHCDIAYMAEDARLRAPFVTLGVVPEAASSYLLPTQIGHQRAAELLFTAAWIDAARALELGLVSRVLSRDELLPAAREKALEIAAMPLGSLRYTKRLLVDVRREGVADARRREDAGFVARVGSPENAEALRAFFEKRPPDFRSVSPRNRDE